MSADPYKYFRIEAVELSERLQALAVELARESPSATRIAEMLRHAHTLKGASRVVKQLGIAEGAHRLEELLVPYRDRDVQVPERAVQAVFEELKVLREQVDAMLQPAQVAPSTTKQARSTFRAQAVDIDAAISGLGESVVEMGSAKRLVNELVDKLSELAESVREQAGDGVVLWGGTTSAVLRTAQTLRASVERSTQQLDATRTLMDRLRLVSVSSLLTTLHLAAGDVAREQGKLIEFEVSGAQLRIEGQVLEALQPALLHIVRNAVAHGIEAPNERLAAGKSAAGKVYLSVNQVGRELVVSCHDDGRGLDIAALRRALAARGNGEAASMDRETLLRLLTNGGVSTKANADAISGRGVGLDVVRDAAEQLGGSVRLFDAEPGFGVELHLPLAAAAIEGLVVNLGDSTVVVPLSAVSATCRVAEIERHRGAEAIAYGDELIPLLCVAGASNIPRCALIIRNSTGAYALGCDRLHGVQTVVMRPLPRLVPKPVPVLGVWLSAASLPRLVLDPERLTAFVRPRGDGSSVAPLPAPVLVIDDSLTTRILEQSILESAGYSVELANCAEQGLEKARARAHSLFLVDVEMPGMSGFEFVEATRADPDLCKTPAVLVSSRSSDEDFERGRRAGAHGYIVKDRFDQRELLGLIEELIGT